MTRIPASQSTCPYCGTKLATVPSRKRHCPSCKQVMYVKTGVDDIDYAVTEDEVRIIKRERRKYNESMRNKLAWVSKSDIVEFLRCEYRVFIAHKLDKRPVEFVDSEFIKAIIEQGSRFEGSIVSQIPFEEVGSIDDVIEEEVIFRSTEIIENHKLGIRGIVDLINIDKGKLYPIEIKSHKNLEESDRLELAFYWRLLQPIRKGKPIPKGFVLLNTGEIVEVVLNEEDFTKLKSLIEKVRLVKEIGCQPIICEECKTCILKDECLSEVYRKGGLSLIHGVASIRDRQLADLGIKNIRALAKADVKRLHLQWKELSPWAPGIDELNKMIIHAKSWLELRPIYFGKNPLPVSNKSIILDLEYDQLSHIWLVGLLVVNSKDDIECHQFFAENKSDERELLINLIDLLGKYSSYQVLTWYGLGADFPQLETAWQKYKLPIIKLVDLAGRHIDLYQFTINSCRFPLKSFGLKEVGKHLGFVRKLNDIDGLVALSMYNEYLDTPIKNKEKRLSIKNDLLAYNREDLEATFFTLNQLELIAQAKDK